MADLLLSHARMQDAEKLKRAQLSARTLGAKHTRARAHRFAIVKKDHPIFFRSRYSKEVPSKAREKRNAGQISMPVFRVRRILKSVLIVLCR